MRKLIGVLGCLLCLILSSCAHKEIPHKFRGVASLNQVSEAQGIWYLQGSSAARGPYTGEFEMRRSDDGTYNVTRVVNYIRYYYRGLRVQEVWSGKALPSPTGLVVSYVMDDKRALNEFFKPTAIDTLEASFPDDQDAIYREWLTTKRDLQEKPLRWVASDFYQTNVDILRVANRYIDAQSLSEAYEIREKMLSDKIRNQ